MIIDTPIGAIEAFDYSDKFLFKDDKSIAFDQNQKLKSMNTSSNKITVIDKKNTKEYKRCAIKLWNMQYRSYYICKSGII